MLSRPRRINLAQNVVGEGHAGDHIWCEILNDYIIFGNEIED